MAHFFVFSLENSMNRYGIRIVLAASLWLPGCGPREDDAQGEAENVTADQQRSEQGGLSVELPGVDVQLERGKGLEVKAPGTDVTVNKEGLEVKAPSVDIKAGREVEAGSEADE